MTSMFRPLLFFWILATATSFLSAQVPDQQFITEDLDFLKGMMEKYNPALRTYNPDFEANAAALLADAAASDSLSLIGYFQYVSRLCALSHEGHFSLGNWSDTVHSGFLQNRYRYLPMSVAILNDKMYVWKDYSDERQLTSGEEIVAVNGKPVREVLVSMSSCLPADGEISTYPIRQMELGFSWMYYLYIDQPDTFRLTVVSEQEANRTVAIGALTRERQGQNYQAYFASEGENAGGESDPFYEFGIEEGIAWLTLPSFDYGEMKEAGVKPKKLYRSIFQQLAATDVANLVIDLRGNSGGRNEFADDLVPYIQQAAPTQPFLRKTISWEGKERTYKIPRQSRYAFEGAIYVLVDGLTYSNGGTLARYLREFGQAIIIGQETGTRYEGFVAGSKQMVTLPHSQIRIGIPRYHILFPPSSEQTTQQRGVMPDVEITESFESRVMNQDLYREQVILLIQAKTEQE